MKSTEKKFVCDLISLVANAVATNTISEAVEYMYNHFPDNELVEHTELVLNKINRMKQN